MSAETPTTTTLLTVSSVKTRRTPADTQAAQLLATRVLVVASGEAADTAAHIDLDVSGLIVAGAAASGTVRSLRIAYDDLTMLIEPRSIEQWATVEAPFVLDADGLFPETLDGQIENGASIAVTPTGVVNAGDIAALKEAVRRVNELDRDDIIFLVPLHYRWLDKNNIRQLIAVLKQSKHPVAIALADGSANPLSHRGTIPSFRRLFRELPWAMPWRIDLAAFDALAHGAHAAAVGQLPSLRRVAFPGKTPFASDKSDTTPTVLRAKLLRYSRCSWMQLAWYASGVSDPCSCPHCKGRDVYRFNGSNEDRLQAHLHNLYMITEMRRSISGFPAEDILRWWQRQLSDVDYARQTLKGLVGVDINETADVKEWRKES